MPLQPIKTKVAHDEYGDYLAPDAPEREAGAYWVRMQDGEVAGWCVAMYRDGKWAFPAGEYSRVTVEADMVEVGRLLAIGGRIPEPEGDD